jgi:hypothetical protein
LAAFSSGTGYATVDNLKAQDRVEHGMIAWFSGEAMSFHSREILVSRLLSYTSKELSRPLIDL